MPDKPKDTYLVEKCGHDRAICGPYSLEHAHKQAGNQYMVVQGAILADRSRITSDALRTHIRTGSIRIMDGTSLDGI